MPTNPLQFKRGLDAARLQATFAAGEPIFTTDTKKLYIGDGTTAGGVEVGGGSSAPNFAVAIATTEGFGLGDWSKYTSGTGAVSTLSTDNGSATFVTATAMGALTLRASAVDDVAAIGGAEGTYGKATFSPLHSSVSFTRLTGYIYLVNLPTGLSASLVGFGANTTGPSYFNWDDGFGNGDNGIYFINQNGQWHLMYRGVNPNTAAFQLYSVNTNVSVTSTWTRFDLEFTRVAGSPPDLSIVAKINGTTVANTLASTIESSQGMELRGVLGLLVPFIVNKKTLGGRVADLLVDNFTLYSEVTR